MLTATRAAEIRTLHNNNSVVTVQQLKDLLGDVSVTFGQIEYVTAVQVAAKHKAEDLCKVTQANVILCSNINAHTSVYANKVKKTAKGIASNNQAAVEAFTPQANYFEHTDCFSIVQHKEHADKHYLYVIYNTAKSIYLHNGKQISRQDICQFLTPSGARTLMSTDTIVHNKTHGIAHRVAVRTIALSNIVSVRARKQFVTV